MVRMDLNGSMSHSLLSPSSQLSNSCYTFRPLCLGGEFLINSERCWSRSYCYTFIWHYYRHTTHYRYTYICLFHELLFYFGKSLKTRAVCIIYLIEQYKIHSSFEHISYLKEILWNLNLDAVLDYLNQQIFVPARIISSIFRKIEKMQKIQIDFLNFTSPARLYLELEECRD